LLVEPFEVEEALLELIDIGEVIGIKDLALDDREVDLNLIEPARVDRQVDQPVPMRLTTPTRWDS